MLSSSAFAFARTFGSGGGGVFASFDFLRAVTEGGRGGGGDRDDPRWLELGLLLRLDFFLRPHLDPDFTRGPNGNSFAASSEVCCWGAAVDTVDARELALLLLLAARSAARGSVDLDLAFALSFSLCVAENCSFSDEGAPSFFFFFFFFLNRLPFLPPRPDSANFICS